MVKKPLKPIKMKGSGTAPGTKKVVPQTPKPQNKEKIIPKVEKKEETKIEPVFAELKKPETKAPVVPDTGSTKPEEVRKDQKLGLITSKKGSLTTKNYRLRPSDLENLKFISKKINNEVERDIDDTAIIRTLLQIGRKSKLSTLKKALKEVALSDLE